MLKQCLPRRIDGRAIHMLDGYGHKSQINPLHIVYGPVSTVVIGTQVPTILSLKLIPLKPVSQHVDFPVSLRRGFSACRLGGARYDLSMKPEARTVRRF